MRNYDLSDLRKLKAEVNFAGLRYDHHNVSDILNRLEEHIDQYERLKSMILYYLGKDYKLTASQMLGPFLKSVARVMGDEVTDYSLDEIEPNGSG